MPAKTNAFERWGKNAVWAAAALFVVSLVADLGSKEWALAELSEERAIAPGPVCEGPYRQRLQTEPVVLIEDFFEFRYTENCGAAFSMLVSAPKAVRLSIFFVAGIVITIVLLRLWWRASGGALFFWAVPLIVSGAAGNLADRVRHGFVVDFIHVYRPDVFDYPTFNVADITISIGIGLLILDSLLESRREKQQAAQK